MRLARLGAGAALSFVCVVVGCSQSPSHSSTEVGRTGVVEQGIQGGTPDGTAHPFAVGVCSGGAKGNCGGYCSGALILPNLVVTARHCVAATAKKILCDAIPPPKFGADKGPLWITTSSNMMQASVGWHEVETVFTTQVDNVCGNDIALLVLKTQVPAADATPAVPAVQYPMTDFNRWPARRVTAIGYGNTGPTGFSAGTRRIRAGIRIECIPGDDFIPCPADFNVNEFFTGDGVCEGDSGSSAFDDKSILNNKPVSFGVLSRGGDNENVDAGTPATLCKGGLYTRLDKFRDLVIQAADSASKNWTLYPKPVPDWTVFVPPPADAGVDAAVKPPTLLGDGFACDTNGQCKSNVCADTGAGKACTAACDESVVPTTCQEGYVCKDAVCVQDLGEPPQTAAAAPGETTTTSGCAVTASPSGTSRALFALAVAAILGAAARRRRPQA